jgi:hypothetical protein
MSSDYLIEKYEHEVDGVKFTIRIEYDDSQDSPRDWDNLGKMVLFHNRYNFPNEQDGTSFSPSDFSGWDEFEAALVKEYDPAVVMPVYMYEHGGIPLNTGGYSCPWDSGRVGFIFATKEDVCNEWKVKRISKKLLDIDERNLKGEVDTYGKYVNGSVYWFSVKDEDGEEIDSCGGYYDMDDCEADAKAACNFEADRRNKVKQLPLPFMAI